MFYRCVVCKSINDTKQKEVDTQELLSDFTITFGSCNKQWKEIIENNLLFKNINPEKTISEGYFNSKRKPYICTRFKKQI